MIRDLVLHNRSYRKFHNDKKVTTKQLVQLIDLARNTPSSKNKQPLKYILLTEDEDEDVNFVANQLKWAKFLTDWDGPNNSEKPPAYIIMLLDKDINPQADIDAGIAAQTILLGAVEEELGGCIIRSINRDTLSKYFNLASNLQIIQVIAIGYPNQTVELTVPVNANSVTYYEDSNGTHYVPKRKLEDIIIIPNKISSNS
ncbi:MAG: nitroreductase family protein [Bacteroidota bacterium]